MKTSAKLFSCLLVSLAIAIGLMPSPALAEDLTAAESLQLTTQAIGSYGVNLASAAYQSAVNPFFASGYGGSATNGYDGECTWYAWGRAYEKLGVALPCRGNANSWTSEAASAGYSTGSEPRANSIMVEHYSGTGHVFFVENVANGYAYVSEGNYNGAYHEDSINLSTMRRTSWPTQPMGSVDYIYLTSNDNAGPSYSGFRFAEIENAKFTVMAKVTDPSGIRSVRYAVWTSNNGQDELVWYDGHCTDGNDVYWAHIPYSEHKNEKGEYIAHLYAYDNAGNLTTAGISYRFDAGDPTVEDFHAWELKDSRFTVSAKITSPNGIGSVRYAVWTEYNGQDDLVWRDAVYETTGKFYYVYVPFSEHNNERGNYIIHLYAYDTGGKLTVAGINYVASPAVPSTTVPEGTYAIRSKLDTSMCVDVAAHSQDDQANVWLWKWDTSQVSGPTCQKFEIKEAGDGSYYIVATHSDKAIEVYGAYRDNGANISQFRQNQTAAQRWYFVKNDDGTYTIRNKATGHVMDVKRAKTENGTNIQQYPSNGGDNQKFYLVPTDVSKWSVLVSSATMVYNGKGYTPSVVVAAGGLNMLRGTDYEVSYANNVDAGTATVTVTGKGGFTGSKTAEFSIAPAPISSASVTVAGQTYTGNALKPAPTVKLGSATLKSGTDYTVTYKDNTNAGTATVTVTGKGNYTGSKTATFRIDPASLSGATVSGLSAKTYTGKALKPAPTVKLGSATLKAGTDYTVSYKDNTAVGTATVTVTGKGNYAGAKTATFEILPAGKGSATVKRLWGQNALETMGAIVDEGAFTKGGTVMVARNDDYYDALTAAGYAGLAGAPVLLTDKGSLSAETRAQVSKLAPSRIVICGGTAAVSSNVERQLRAAAPGAAVERAWGDNAIGTANDVALKAVKATGKGFSGACFVATPNGYWDALAAAPVAYALGMPVFLANFDGTVDPSTLSAMRELGITKAYVAGGYAALPKTVESQLAAAKVKVEKRFAGANACDTSQLVAAFGVSRGLTADGVGVATRDGYWDALCGAALCGHSRSVLVLAADDDRSAVDGFVKQHAGDIAVAYVFGGPAAVSEATLEAVERAAK